MSHLLPGIIPFAITEAVSLWIAHVYKIKRGSVINGPGLAGDDDPLRCGDGDYLNFYLLVNYDSMKGIISN